MRVVLAIDTSTDACTVGVATPDGTDEIHRLLPRAHNRHVLAMVEDVLRPLTLTAVDGLVCGLGPGSFTGLRIAAAVMQGFAWSLERPLLGMCSLEAQAHTWLLDHARYEGWLLSTTDAQIQQCYYRWFYCQQGQLSALTDARMGKPEQLTMPLQAQRKAGVVIGSGCHYQGALLSALKASDPALHQCAQSEAILWFPEARPRGTAMATWGRLSADWSDAVAYEALIPHYVQQDVGWKKLAEQPNP